MRLYCVVMLAGALGASASMLSPEQALSRVSGDREQKPTSESRLVETFDVEGHAAAYLFSRADGWMLLSADDVAAPVLAYGQGIAADMAPAAREWIDFYCRRIAWARENGCKAFAEPRVDDAPEREAIEPLLRVEWGQSEPFNRLCPMVGDRRSVTGCVATAMAQVMTFHRYPTTGTGTNEYVWEHGVPGSAPVEEVLSLDFTSTVIDWDNILDDYSGDYTETEALAAATLNYCAGIAVNMNYNPYASAAISGDISYGICRFLGYNNKARIMSRDCYWPQGGWDDYVYQQIAEYGPLVYLGTTASDEGHAFVCDGYSSDGFFHFNWGWYGLSNGYYRLDALNPEVQGTGGSSKNMAFNYRHSILACLVASAEPDTEFVPDIEGFGSAFSTLKPTVALGSRFTLLGNLGNMTSYPMEIEFGCLMTDSPLGHDGRVLAVKILSLDSREAMKIYEKVTMPEDMDEGIYCMRPAFRVKGSEAWHPMPWPVAYGAWLWVTVKDGVATFSTDEPSGVEPVTADAAACAPVYYDLQGRRLSRPLPGQPVIEVTPGSVSERRY